MTRQGCRVYVRTLTLALGLALQPVLAEDVCVGHGERQTVVAAADTVFADKVQLGAGGTLVKKGAGTLTVPLSSIQLGTGTLEVRQGAVDVVDTGAEASVAAEPTAVLNRAALWLDCSVADSVLTTSSNGTAWVDAWLDVRETGNATDGWTRLRAMPNFYPTNIPPSLVTKNGTTSLYFGGYGSGISMDWTKPDGSLCEFQTIRHVFLVHGVWNSYGYVLGLHQKPYAEGTGSTFHIGNQSGDKMTPIYRQSYVDAAAPYCGRVYQNGRRVDPCETSPLQQQFQLQEVDCCVMGGRASSFFNDRNYFSPNTNFTSRGGNRIGGDYLAAAIVFTNALTETERVQIESWLMGKWKLSAQAIGNAALAKGTRASAPVDNLSTVLASTSGDGVLGVQASSTLPELRCTRSDAYLTPVDLASGTLMYGPDLPLNLSGGHRYTMTRSSAKLLPALTAAADAAETTVVKDGAGDVTVTGLKAGVSNLVVSAGTFALAAPSASMVTYATNDVVAGTVRYGEFEDWTGGSVQLLDDTVYSGWHLVGLQNSANNYRDVVIFTSGDGTGSGWMGATSGYGAPLPAPDGSRIMMLKGDASGWTEVTLPEDGVYDVSFNLSARTGYGGLQMDLCIGSDADHLLPFATVASASGSWTLKKFRMPWLCAGTYQFWFRNKKLAKDLTFAVDNLALTGVPCDARTRLAVPNGSFESVVANFSETSGNTNDNALCWHFIPNETWSNTSDIPPIFISTPSMGAQFYDESTSSGGSRQLVMTARGSTAENTFTVAEGGTWKLALQAETRRRANATATGSTLTAEIVRGTTTNSLGTCAVSAFHLKEYVFPNTVTLAAGETVTLRLTLNWTYVANSITSCATLVDDVEFRSAQRTSENLVANGSFETTNAWKTTIFPKASATGINGNRRWTHPDCSQYYGYAVYDGNWRMSIVQNDITWQTIDVPEAGVYRLRYFTHSRADNPSSYGNNPVNAFWMDPATPAKTNWIGRTLSTATNFVEASFLVRLPARDGLVLGFQGGYSHLAGVAEFKGNDHTAMLDGVSLRLADVADDALPDVDENLEIRVETGAKLRLDFAGTLPVSRVRLGGRAASGTVSAETDPDYILGPGALEIKPRGLTIYIR